MMSDPASTGRFDDSRRGFVKKAAYAVPAIVTLSAVPALAKAGSVTEVVDKPGATDCIGLPTKDMVECLKAKDWKS
jgi:hypothetical protein